MIRFRRAPLCALLLLCVTFALPAQDEAGAKDNKKVVAAAELTKPAIWSKPDDVAGRDLYFGQGGEKHQPRPPFTFEKEATTGTNPKFDVRDADGHKWRVKLGEEPRPEVVASRLLWSVGYFANDDYLLPTATVENLKLNRGGNQVKHGEIINARFQRRPGGEKKIGVWLVGKEPVRRYQGTERPQGPDGDHEQLGPEGREQRRVLG